MTWNNTFDPGTHRVRIYMASGSLFPCLISHSSILEMALNGTPKMSMQELRDDTIGLLESLKMQQHNFHDTPDEYRRERLLNFLVRHTARQADATFDLRWETDELGRPTTATLALLKAHGAPGSMLEFADRSGRHWWWQTWDETWVDSTIKPVFPASRPVDDVVRWSAVPWGELVDWELGDPDIARVVDEGHGCGLPDEATIDALDKRGMFRSNDVIEWNDKAGSRWIMEPVDQQKQQMNTRACGRWVPKFPGL